MGTVDAVNFIGLVICFKEDNKEISKCLLETVNEKIKEQCQTENGE